METNESVIPKRSIISITLIFYTVSFLIPFLISGPQLLTGILVNTFLYLASLKLKRKSLYLLLTLPSIGAFSHGAVFGPLTFFLFYFLPFIWIGNAIMVEIFSFSKFKKMPGLIKILLSAGAKSVFLFIAANIYFSLHIVPKIFVTSMGIFQFITAISAGALTLIILKLNLFNERTK